MLRLKSTGVKSITAVDYLHTKGNRPEKGNLIKKLEFNSEGNLTKEVEYESNEVLTTTSLQYENGKLKAEYHFKDSATLLTKTEFKYNSSGAMTIMFISGASGNKRYREERKYDKFGKLSTILKEPQNGLQVEKHYTRQYDRDGRVMQLSETNKYNKPIRTEYYNYDSLSQKTETLILNPSKGKVLVEKLVYDGTQLNEKHLFTDEGVPHTSHYYTNNDKTSVEKIVDHIHDTEYVITKRYKKGRIVEEVGGYPLDDKIDYGYKVKYSCKGQEKKFTELDTDGSPKKIINYTWDKRGNIVEEEISNGKNTFRTIEYEIQYYPVN